MPKEAKQTFAPRRGRPTAKQTAAIEQAIVDCARTMFIEQGYDAAAMETVATKLGISKGTLYARYSSKEALLTAVIQESVKRWSAEAAQFDGQLTDDIGQRLQHHGKIIAASMHNLEIQAFQRLLLAKGNSFPELGEALNRFGTQHIVDIIASDMITAGEKDGQHPSQPSEVAMAFVSAITGWYMQQTSFRPVTPKELESFAKRVAVIFLEGRAGW